jgi:hypothetical protein
MFESSNMLFVTVYGKADALGDLTTTNAATKRRNRCGLRGGYGCRRRDDPSCAINGRDDRQACGRRIYNQFATRTRGVPAFAAWPAALRRLAPPATLAQPPTLN